MEKQGIIFGITTNYHPWQCLCLLLGMTLWMGCTTEVPEDIQAAMLRIPEKVDYNFHVKPILADRCFPCHGPDAKKRKANLRLDDADAALAELKDSPGKFAIVPGRLRKSQAFYRILSSDPETMMPPPDANLFLSDEEKAILIKWISQGAAYKDHWAFISPHEPPLPAVKNGEWVQNSIDRFILQALEAKNWEPSPKASREQLIRRLSFDIRGIPPTLEEIDAFLNDSSPDAFDQLIVRFLNAPEYGERMTALWLDVARYADSDGYLDDKHRDFSPWRDWVIKAFNENMPYDRFVTWQLAGDLIPGATQESVLATAFNRLNKKNSEAGIVFEEYRVEYVADRTHTFGKAFAGLSLECARCHDHKFDPISQEDYYKVFAFFNSTFEIGTAVYGPGQTPGPALLLTPPEQQEIIEFLNAKIKSKEEKLARQLNETTQKILAGESNYLPLENTLEEGISKSTIAHHSFDHVQEKEGNAAVTINLVNPAASGKISDPNIKPGVKGKAFFVDNYNHAVFGEKIGWFERTGPFTIDLWLYPEKVYEKAGIFYHCEELRLGFKGYSLHLEQNKLRFIMAHTWPQNAIEVVSIPALREKEWSHIALSYDGSGKACGVKMYINGKASGLETRFDHLYKGILFEPDIHTYGFDGFRIGYRDKITPFKGGGIDEVRIFNRQLTPLEILYLHNPGQAKETLAAGPGTKLPDSLLVQHLASSSNSVAALLDSLSAIRSRLNQLTNDQKEIMVMGDMAEPRPTYILERGRYDRPGKMVEPGTPAKVFPFNPEWPPNRLGLARWLFNKDNPLTARVFVNRIWQMHFGQGLVKTSEDFGYQGALPSHPELLDWLAVQFVASGWDIKKLHQLIFQSATYQQSSLVTPASLARDPENFFLARGPRFRLPAEMIRDNALAVSGLLRRQIGGQSVYPYQPPGLWDELSNKSWRYPYLQEAGPGLYRRSIYTIWKRTSPPPSMLIFDSPDRGTCTVRRTLTSTPLQALVLLNDPQYIEASRVIAENLMRAEVEVQEQLQKAFRLLTSRHADAKEMQILYHFFKQEEEKFLNNEKDARAFLEVGEHQWDTNLHCAHLAALAVVVNGIMNTDEAHTRM